MILPDESADHVIDMLQNAYKNVHRARNHLAASDREPAKLLHDAMEQIETAVNEIFVQGHYEEKKRKR